MLREKVSCSNQSEERLGEGKKGEWVRSRRNMTAVAEGDVTRCQGL